MSLQDVVGDSDLRKSRFANSASLLTTLFVYEGTGSPKDRLLTALYVLAAALGLSMLAVSLPHGGVLVVGWAVLVAGMSAFEVARLSARSSDTLAYRPIFGTLMFALLALPTVAAAYGGVQQVGSGVFNWKLLAVSVALAAQGVLVLQVFEGRSDIQRASTFGAAVVPAMLLVSVGAPLLVVLSGTSIGVQLVWWLVAVVALNDAGAYFVGRKCGRTKLAPALSPNKTLEGSVAGLCIGTVAGVIFWQLLLGSCALSSFAVGVMSFIAVCSAQCADLSKSYVKRVRGVKDTGALFPGHGGMLDRFDGMIGAAPVVVSVLALYGLLQ
jgi:CDP-diglyceride synthetase